MEALLYSLQARRILASLKKEGGKIIASKTLALLVSKGKLPWHVDPFGTGRKTFLESEIRTWWSEKLKVSNRPVPFPGRPRRPRL